MSMFTTARILARSADVRLRDVSGAAEQSLLLAAEEDQAQIVGVAIVSESARHL